MQLHVLKGCHAAKKAKGKSSWCHTHLTHTPTRPMLCSTLKNIIVSSRGRKTCADTNNKSLNKVVSTNSATEPSRENIEKTYGQKKFSICICCFPISLFLSPPPPPSAPSN